jgi:nanoRNase/pAp phosphatase (c-di-AMP/oligoRNAs hydrolase)
MHSIQLKSTLNNLQEEIKLLILTAKNITILTHSNADPDALGSACAMANFISKLNPIANVRIVISDGIGNECKELLRICTTKGIKIEITKKSHRIEDISEDLCVLVDVASTEQLRYAKFTLTACKTIIIIDHHESHNYEEELLKNKNVIYILDATASSTAEIIYKFIKEFNINVDTDYLTILLAGIIWDTKRFLRISSNTFKYVAEIIEKGTSYSEVLKLIEGTKPIYSRIARIKCLLRHRGFKMVTDNKEVYIAVSEVGAYESDCATALITMGYDVAIVVSEDESLKALRLIYRAREEILNEINIDIYRDIIKKLIEVFGGGGGGHKGAGGAIIRTYNIEALFKEIVKVLYAISSNRLYEFEEKKVG